MPRRYRKKRYRKKRYRKKRNGRKTYVAGISNSLGTRMYSPLPRTLKASFKYSDIFDLDVAAAFVPDVIVFSANGMFLVDHSGSGTAHQPRGYDQLVGILYDHYTVVAASISVTFTNSTLVQAGVVGISVRDDLVPEVLVNTYMEDTDTRFAIVSNRDAGPSSKTVKVNLNPAKFLGLPKPILGNSALKGNLGANPTEMAFFHVWFGGLSSSADMNCQCIVSINYIAILQEPKNPAQS